MKKKIVAALLAVLMFTMSMIAEATRLEFKIGETIADVDHVNKIDIVSYLSEQGNTMVGLRAVSEALGLTVEWNEAERKVLLSDLLLKMSVTIDSDIAIVNGKNVKMTEPARIYNDRTVVPVRFVSESFGAEVEYIKETGSVIVTGPTLSERYLKLEDEQLELAIQYPDALKGWISTTDEKITTQGFINVWNSLVNTKIMELWPDKEFSVEECEDYMRRAGMDFEFRFMLLDIEEIFWDNPDMEITKPITIQPYGWYDMEEYYRLLTYNPEDRSIKLKTQSEVEAETASSNGGSGGGGATSGSVGTIAGSASNSTGSAVLPTAPMPGTAESIPPYKPVDNDSEPTIKDYTSEYNPTPEPTPQITEGPEGKDNHFNDMIDGL